MFMEITCQIILATMSVVAFSYTVFKDFRNKNK